MFAPPLVRFPVQLSPRAFVPSGVDLAFTAGAQAVDGQVAEPRRIGRHMDIVVIIDLGLRPTISTSSRH
jgi:hypothetical protein